LLFARVIKNREGVLSTKGTDFEETENGEILESLKASPYIEDQGSTGDLRSTKLRGKGKEFLKEAIRKGNLFRSSLGGS